MIRKKGSLIIENMLASAMIVLLLLIICQSAVCKGKWQEIKKKKDEFERITYAVEEELKYNLSIEEVKGLSYKNIVSLDKDNILKLLTIEGLEMIQKGDDIVIVIEDMDKDRIKINICLREECYGNTVESKRSFVKDRTMNEYYKQK